MQIFPYCNFDSETVVLAHAPSELKGISTKSPDWWAAFSCSACHDIIDARRHVDLTSEEVFECFMRGVFRTIQRQIEKGLIVVDC